MILVKDENGFERIVFGEVLLPDTINVYGDFHTKESIRQFAYGFMIAGFGIDHEHRNQDVSESVKVVESFIARKGDPDFNEGAWVIGMYIGDDDLWQAVLDGDINGYSYEALVQFLGIQIQTSMDRVKYGTTEEYPVDGHLHNFTVVIDEDGRPITGGTSIDNGHSHSISSHSVTDQSFGHTHRYNYTLDIGG